jgi:hypothetical protein
LGPSQAQQVAEGPTKLGVSSEYDAMMSLIGKSKTVSGDGRHFPCKHVPTGARGLVTDDGKPLVFQSGLILYAETEEGDQVRLVGAGAEQSHQPAE